MEDLSGEWVILKDNEIVERNKDLSVIFKLAEKYEDSKITIVKEPSTEYDFYVQNYKEIGEKIIL